MPMTPEAKSKLSSTIRGLRERLLADLHGATEGAYRLSAPVDKARLDEAARIRRQRLEDWLDEQVRTVPAKKRDRAWDRFRADVEKEAAYTLLNRLVLLRLLEAAGLTRVEVLTGGWESGGYREFRDDWAPALCNDATEGYALLLQLTFDELAEDLPGLYGDVGLTSLVPLPPATLRAVVEALNQPELDSCWTDDMTLGWVYQYWNDPEREALDAKLNSGGKVEPHEIASKTQMFTERYMVDWLLQNSLGPMWLAMCRKHGWTPEVKADGTLDRLEERRVEWRAKRDAGEVDLTALMPLYGDAERRWACYVPQPIPDDAVEHAPESVRELKILDPAVGSGHFLVVAFDLLVALYREEARHRGEQDEEARWSDRAIVERILEHNLNGIDLDPRAVQIAAAALWLKARQAAADIRPRQLNLVASNLRLSSLPDDDPALVELRMEIEAQTGIPGSLTDTLVSALKGADHLGSLLKVDQAVEDAIRVYERRNGAVEASQGGLFHGFAPQQKRLGFDEARRSVTEQLERFLEAHTGGDDLGLRLRGEQLAAGVRFVRMIREGTYDLVLGNPPYQGTSKMVDPGYVRKHYLRGKADLYAAFLERCLHLSRHKGMSALLTMRNWMFIKQYSVLRTWLLETFDLRVLGDFAIGAFDEVPNDLLSVSVSVFRRATTSETESVALQPTPPDDRSYDRDRTKRKKAAVIAQVGRYGFTLGALQTVPDKPLVYWWDQRLFQLFQEYRTIGELAPVRQGMKTCNNTRFVRRPWEVVPSSIGLGGYAARFAPWVPIVMGAAGKAWIEPVDHILMWHRFGLCLKAFSQYLYKSYTRTITNEEYYFKKGVAFSMIGTVFRARVFRENSTFGGKGSAVFGDDLIAILASMNRTESQEILQSLNPGVGFEVGDVNRLPLAPVKEPEEIFTAIDHAFSEHESHRESSIEYRCPGPTFWSSAQEWAQNAIDGRAAIPLVKKELNIETEPSTDHLSFAVGVTLGRLSSNGEGTLDPNRDNLSHALPAGILFLDGTLDPDARGDDLGHLASTRLWDTWRDKGALIDPRSDLRTYLRLKFFGDVHRKMYESRPIHWPLSSEKKTFVAWINIHRWTADTLRILLADHLLPTRKRLEGEMDDLRTTRDGVDRKAARAAESRYTRIQAWYEELCRFIDAVEQCAEKGPPPTDSKCPEREVDARFDPDLDDGVMINSAALWPLLEPQWKDPKKWWKELCLAKGRKDYDWAHLAARYFPERVRAKCEEDPSLGVAHGCFWRYHPERAYAWELRLQDEIAPDFTIDEEDSDACREALLRDYPELAEEIRDKEMKRRERKAKNAGQDGEPELPFGEDDEDESGDGDLDDVEDEEDDA